VVEIFAIFFYSISKMFFLLREIAGVRNDKLAVRRWKIAAWATALIGLPFVTAILLSERDWIFGWLELVNAPVMTLGLVLAALNIKLETPRWVDYATYAAMSIGFAWSAIDFGTLLSINQTLEAIAVFTFIPGNYLLVVREDRRGYLWYLAMFAAAGTLLYRQEHFWFAMQQVGSATAIAAAYWLAGYRTKQTSPPRE
jgi:hypothetical protein